MTREIIYAPEAEIQLLQLYRHLAREASPDIARRYLQAVTARCDGLIEFPDRGTPRDDIRAGLRTIPFRRRVTIAYAVGPERVTVLGVFYGGQDFETILRE